MMAPSFLTLSTTEALGKIYDKTFHPLDTRTGDPQRRERKGAHNSACSLSEVTLDLGAGRDGWGDPQGESQRFRVQKGEGRSQEIRRWMGIKY